MSKALDIGKESTKGSFHYLWGLVVSTLISSIGTIFIARLLGSDQYGLYTIVLSVPLLIVTFRDWGINLAMVKFTAQFRAEDRIEETRNIIVSGLAFEVLIGFLLSLSTILSADYVATSFFNRPTIAPLIQVASVYIFTGGLIAAATAAFTGFEKMELNSIMIVCQSIFRTFLIIALVLMGLGTSGAIIGFAFGTIIAGIIGLIIIWQLYSRIPRTTHHSLEIKAYISTMLTYGLPLSLATIIIGVLPQYYVVLLPIYYAANNNTAIGNYGIAMNFVVLITFFSMPIITMLFPAFSKLNPYKDKDSLRIIFRLSVKYASLFVVPVSFLVMCLAVPAVSTLFGNTYESAALFLALLAIQYLFTAFGNLSISGLLSGQGKTGFVLKTSILTGLIGFLLGYFAIIAFGVLGLILTTIIASVPSLILGIRFIQKNYDVSIDWVSSVKILSASGITALVTYVFISIITLPSWIQLLLGTLLFVGLFTVMVLLFKAIDKNDLTILSQMTTSLGGVGLAFRKVISLLEKAMDLLKKMKLSIIAILR
jgi:O-antigen/teichoic acid export membrane protein